MQGGPFTDQNPKTFWSLQAAEKGIYVGVNSSSTHVEHLEIPWGYSISSSQVIDKIPLASIELEVKLFCSELFKWCCLHKVVQVRDNFMSIGPCPFVT